MSYVNALASAPIRHIMPAFAAIAITTAAGAAPRDATDILNRLFQAPTANPQWFAPSFLTQIPIETVNTLIQGMKQRYGTFKTCNGTGEDYVCHLAEGDVRTLVVLNTNGQITGLLIRPDPNPAPPGHG